MGSLETESRLESRVNARAAIACIFIPGIVEVYSLCLFAIRSLDVGVEHDGRKCR